MLHPHGDHHAPTRGGRLGAESKEVEGGFDEQSARRNHRRKDDHVAGRVGPDVLECDPGAAGARGAGGLHELHRFETQDFAAHEPGEHAQFRQRDGEDGVEEIGAERRHDGQRQDQGRNGQQGVDHPHDQRVPESAQIRRDKSEDGPRRQRQGNGAGHDLQGDAPAEDDAAGDVAAELVGSKPMGRARRAQYLLDVDMVRIEGRQQRRQKCHQHEAQNENRPHRALPVFEQVARQAGSSPVAGRRFPVGRAGSRFQPGRFSCFAHDPASFRHTIKCCLIRGSTYAYRMSVIRFTNMTSSTTRKMLL